MAAVLASGDGALLSHRSAATLWNLRTGGTKIEVTAESSGRRGPAGLVLRETRHLHPSDRWEIDGIPITSLARTLVDLAAVVDRRRLERAFEEADRIGKLDLKKLEAALDRARGKRGVKTLRRLIAEQRTAFDTRSDLERDLIAYLREHGLPLPQCNVLVEGYLVDAYWPDRRLVVELDGYAFHDRTHRSFDGDRERTVDLQLGGYTVVRLTSKTLGRIEGFLSTPAASAGR